MRIGLAWAVWTTPMPCADAAGFRAGSAAVEIAPQRYPVIVNAMFTERSATGMVDRLHARALVLDDGIERLAVAVVDTCMMPRDLLDEAKFAARLEKHRTGNAAALSASEALAMATTVPAEAFALGSGRIAEGEAADLILVDLRGAGTQPVHDPVSTLIYAANASHVHTTICAGRVLMHDRVVEVCDEEEVIREAQESAARMAAPSH